MKRVGFKRNVPVKPVSEPVKAQTYMKMADDLFMPRYCALPCEICGKTHALGKPSVGHHILPKSIYPEYRYEPRNMITLCPICHGEAHAKEKKLMTWLSVAHISRWQWVMANCTHVDKPALNYKEEYERLLKEKENHQ